MVFRTDYENQTPEEREIHRRRLVTSHKNFWANASKEFRDMHSASTSKTSKEMWKNRTEEQKIFCRNL